MVPVRRARVRHPERLPPGGDRVSQPTRSNGQEFRAAGFEPRERWQQHTTDRRLVLLATGFRRKPAVGDLPGQRVHGPEVRLRRASVAMSTIAETDLGIPPPGNRLPAAHAGRSRRGLTVLALLCVLSALAVLGWALYLTGGTTRGAGSASAAASPGTVDIGFSQAMSVHHQQAVYMSQIVLQRPGASPEIRALANTIIQAQLQEIGWMGGWL